MKLKIKTRQIVTGIAILFLIAYVIASFFASVTIGSGEIVEQINVKPWVLAFGGEILYKDPFIEASAKINGSAGLAIAQILVFVGVVGLIIGDAAASKKIFSKIGYGIACVSFLVSAILFFCSQGLVENSNPLEGDFAIFGAWMRAGFNQNPACYIQQISILLMGITTGVAVFIPPDKYNDDED